MWSKKAAGDEGGGAECIPDAKLSMETLTSIGRGKWLWVPLLLGIGENDLKERKVPWLKSEDELLNNDASWSREGLGWLVLCGERCGGGDKAMPAIDEEDLGGGDMVERRGN